MVDEVNDKRLERIARDLCMVSGLKPDALVYSIEPAVVDGAPRRLYYAPAPTDVRPLWHSYVLLARMVLKEAERG